MMRELEDGLRCVWPHMLGGHGGPLFQHSLFVEADERKQRWLMVNTGGAASVAPVAPVFGDVLSLCGPRLIDLRGGVEVPVPSVAIIFIGLPCQSVSTLNMAAGHAKDIIRAAAAALVTPLPLETLCLW
jgi:hypothetical protein